MFLCQLTDMTEVANRFYTLVAFSAKDFRLVRAGKYISALHIREKDVKWRVYTYMNQQLLYEHDSCVKMKIADCRDTATRGGNDDNHPFRGADLPNCTV
jgi:hypothetical protein